MYAVSWSSRARADLRGLPIKVADQILKKVETYLAKNPRQLGAQLSGDFSGYYRYRMGDYRIIYKVLEDIVCIDIIRVGHRKDVYE